MVKSVSLTGANGEGDLDAQFWGGWWGHGLRGLVSPRVRFSRRITVGNVSVETVEGPPGFLQTNQTAYQTSKIVT